MATGLLLRSDPHLYELIFTTAELMGGLRSVLAFGQLCQSMAFSSERICRNILLGFFCHTMLLKLAEGN